MVGSSLVEKGRKALARLWRAAQKHEPAAASTLIPEQVTDAIARSINSSTKSYRYVLPTQLLAKLVAPGLDCRALQEGGGVPGSFDARSFCSKVIVEFDSANHNVLGGSGDPYVSNPLRQASLTEATRSAHRNKAGFDDLLVVLNYAEQHPDKLDALVACALRAVYDRLGQVHVVYPVPNRASHAQVQEAVRAFLGERTGGLRLQVVSVALFRTIGAVFKLFNTVTSANINAADSQTGKAADLECLGEDDEVVFAVEVKDRELTLRSVQEKLPHARERGIRELLFLVQGGVAAKDAAKVKQTILNEFITGQNVYVSTLEEFMNACLILFGEEGRRTLLLAIGECLDEFKADLPHRQAWQSILRNV